MTIKMFKMKQKGLYELVMDNGKVYSFYEEVILKYELLLSKKIEDKLLPSLLEENKKYECYYKGLERLNKKAETRDSLARYLLSKGYTDNEIEFVTEKLESQGYLNDSNYASSYVNNKVLTTSWGKGKIKRQLLQKGVNEQDCDKALESYSKDIELEKLVKRINKKIRSNHDKSNKVLKMKLESDLVSEGFSKELINKALSEADFSDDSEIAKRTYEKLLIKFGRKYEGRELEYKVKQKMASLGFYNYGDE